MKNLDNLVKKFKNQDTLMDIKEVHVLTQNTSLTNKGNFANKNTLFTLLSIVVFMGILSLVWKNNNPQTQETVAKVEMNKPQEQSIIEKDPVVIKEDQIITENNTEIGKIGPAKKIIKHKTPVLPSISKSHQNGLDFYPTSVEEEEEEGIEEGIEDTSVINKPTLLKETQDTNLLNTILSKAIVLTPKELEKFHIYTHDDVLLYSNFDSEKKKYVEIYATNIYGTGRSASRLTTEEDPVLVQRPMSFLYKSPQINKDSFNEKNHFPIFVPSNNSGFPYSVWWFKRNTTNQAKLPLRYQDKHLAFDLKVADIQTDSSKDLNIFKIKKEHFKRNDSLIYIPNQLIYADKKLLKKLHIKVSTNSVQYKRIMGLKKVASYTQKVTLTNVILPSKNMYTEQYSKRTPPSFITSESMKHKYVGITEFISTNNGADHTSVGLKNSKQYFYANKNSMLAIKVAEIDGDEIVFWYENTKRLLQLIPEKEQVEKILNLKDQLQAPIAESRIRDNKLNYEKMMEFKELKSLVLNPIKLDTIQLNKLNIKINNGFINYTILDSTGYQMKYTLDSRYSFLDITPTLAKPIKNPIIPKYISDKYGNGQRLNVSKDSFTTQNLDRLIPVLVETGRNFYLSEYMQGYFHPDCIFWFEPTPEFLNTLDEETREQLTYELSLMEKDTSQVTLPKEKVDSSIKSCVYLTPCSDIKNNIQECFLFPNPTKGITNVSVTMNMPCSGTINIYSLTGKNMKTQTINDLSTKFPLDLSHFPSGIYLIYLSTEDGDKLTRRIIKE